MKGAPIRVHARFGDATNWRAHCTVDGQRSALMIQIKRTYELAARGDGWRVIVERLWPRGMKKAEVHADAWIKDVAPSTELRTWYGHRPQRWQEFRKRYRRELNNNKEAWSPIMAVAKRRNVTLLYSAHDELHNGALVLRDYLQRRLTSPSHRGASKSGRLRRRRSPSRSR
jgi:uncharacterized protein YeaO (DUF488 family)